MKFTVKRSTWLRGETPDGSMLLRPRDRKMCCLGFRCLAAGLTEEQIFDRTSPSDALPIDLKDPNWSKYVYVGEKDLANTEECKQLMNVNDNEHISRQEREERLTRLFAAIGDEVEFVD